MEKRRRFYLGIIFLFSVLFSLGMGSLKEIPEEIPLPEKGFSALVTDQENLETFITKVSCEGKVFIKGERGKALVTIPFEKISWIVFGEEGGELKAKVMLKDGKDTWIKVEKESKWYGKAEFGNFQIESKDLKRVVFK